MRHEAWKLLSVLWSLKYWPLLGWSLIIPEHSLWSMAILILWLTSGIIQMHLSFMLETRALPRPTRQRSLHSQAEPSAQPQLLKIKALKFVETSLTLLHKSSSEAHANYSLPWRLQNLETECETQAHNAGAQQSHWLAGWQHVATIASYI